MAIRNAPEDERVVLREGKLFTALLAANNRKLQLECHKFQILAVSRGIPDVNSEIGILLLQITERLFPTFHPEWFGWLVPLDRQSLQPFAYTFRLEPAVPTVLKVCHQSMKILLAPNGFAHASPPFLLNVAAQCEKGLEIRLRSNNPINGFWKIIFPVQFPEHESTFRRPAKHKMSIGA